MKLLDQVSAKTHKKHCSIRTEQAYVDRLKRFLICYRKRHPKDMREKEISQYLSRISFSPGLQPESGINLPEADSLWDRV
jgi:hypothetical protein